jgi:hypothetical protein
MDDDKVGCCRGEEGTRGEGDQPEASTLRSRFYRVAASSRFFQVNNIFFIRKNLLNPRFCIKILIFLIYIFFFF